MKTQEIFDWLVLFIAAAVMIFGGSHMYNGDYERAAMVFANGAFLISFNIYGCLRRR